MSIGGWVIAIVQKSKMAAIILDFISVQKFGIPACRTSNVMHVPNFLQICAIVNELWAINEIQNGGRRRLKFVIFVHFALLIFLYRLSNPCQICSQYFNLAWNSITSFFASWYQTECLVWRCISALCRWSRDQVHLQDKKYGGTPLHWAQTKEVQHMMDFVKWWWGSGYVLVSFVCMQDNFKS